VPAPNLEYKLVHWPREDVYHEAWEVFDPVRQDSVAWFVTEGDARQYLIERGVDPDAALLPDTKEDT
jgi:hypothetical protein